MLPNGVRAIGIPIKHKGKKGIAQLIGILSPLQPTHLIVRTPMISILEWGCKQGIKVLPMFADSFQRSIRSWWRHYKIAKLLNSDCIDWVGNHNHNAAQSLCGIGVSPDKVIPWDWPPIYDPDTFPTKTLPENDGLRRMIFVGNQSKDKGLGDTINSLALLVNRGIDIMLTSVGPGIIDHFKDMAKELDVEERIDFLGQIAHDDVIKLMHDHDLIIIPSRHSYPEGLPMTIYDAFISRTPIVASDHPMFLNKIEPEVSGIIFEASNPTSLADQIERILENSLLYNQLSENSPNAFRKIACPALWDEVINHWLSNSEIDKSWLKSMTLSQK
jgi:glycosyltransferase involved in cell wall biosynthesis